MTWENMALEGWPKENLTWENMTQENMTLENMTQENVTQENMTQEYQNTWNQTIPHPTSIFFACSTNFGEPPLNLHWTLHLKLNDHHNVGGSF